MCTCWGHITAYQIPTARHRTVKPAGRASLQNHFCVYAGAAAVALSSSSCKAQKRMLTHNLQRAMCAGALLAQSMTVGCTSLSFHVTTL